MHSTRRSLTLGLCLLIALGILYPRLAWSNSRSFAYKRILSATTPGAGNFFHPTVISLSPDGSKIYVAQQNGRIFWADVDANFNLGTVHEIDTIFDYTVTGGGRLVTGMAFNPANGDLYVAHSDPLIFDATIDIYSGTISRLHADGTMVTREVARLLPRSKADHGPNGLSFHAGKLYLAEGSMTNEGLPAQFYPNPTGSPPYIVPFFNQVEQPLSAAILEFDLSQSPPITPVVYATGLRNPYDLLWHSGNGHLYASDNGANLDSFNSTRYIWYGDRPVGGTGSNACNDSGSNVTAQDRLNLIAFGGYYGHPNPSRNECTFQGGPSYQSPVFEYGWGSSSDGIAEYNSLALPGLYGQIITANWGSQTISSVNVLGVTTGVTGNFLHSGLNRPIDVAVRASDGAIFVAEYGPALTGEPPSYIGVYMVKPAVGVDYEGDRTSNLITFNPTSGWWTVRRSDTGTTFDWGPYGGGGDVPFAFDFAGIGSAQFVAYRPSTAVWYIAGIGDVTHGSPYDLPVAGDVDGDGRVDLIAFHDATAVWSIRNTATGAVTSFGPWGATGDVPFAIDMAGYGYAQLATFRPSTAQWYVAGIGGPWTVGSPGDIPVAGDVDGDGKVDLISFHEATAVWTIRNSATGAITTFGPWGAAGDTPFAIDFAGLGYAQLATWRPSTAQWYVAGIGGPWTVGYVGNIAVRPGY